eukprot:TRINITY_DN7346_c0_g1_i1.p1 TRINITY_DN7346_c0_g1~~TRINITY_DN7346_c0_g1_i1.p1  ORF type:complete len:921 (+),score=320.70 TRINITY_DN7346_c0_g1_i1:154-2916(+)
MGKKVKVGKERRDKFYHLAKETGLRARSAFKLIQLNRKYNFLQKSKVCIDLCAAPGGWMQVAVQNMPPQSLVIGVDLVPIKAIKGCISLQADITTERCRQMIRKEVKHLKADVVLHDGAPNVGTSWIQDSFDQASLVLKSLKLATEFLVEDGVFVTKVFRSRDYQSLMWVFKQLFRKVQATKPTSSRNVSAEIFVVCQGFLAPHRIDPKMLDVKYVFSELEENRALPDIFKQPKKRKALGYDDDTKQTMHSTCPIEDFIQGENHLDMLAAYNEFKFDPTSIITKHPSTTDEIKLLCSDLKVLGKKDFRILLKWRLSMKDVLAEVRRLAREEAVANGELPADDRDSDDNDDGDENDAKDSQADSEDELETALAEANQALRAKEKRQRRLKAKENRKLREKMALQMDTPTDMGYDEDATLFKLKGVKNKTQLAKLEDAVMDEFDADPFQIEGGDADLDTALTGRPEQQEQDEEDSDEDPVAMMEQELDQQYQDYCERKGKRYRRVKHHNKTMLLEADVAAVEREAGEDADAQATTPPEDHDSDDSDDNENESGVLTRKASHATASSAAWFAQFDDLDEDLDDLDDAPDSKDKSDKLGDKRPPAKKRKSARETKVDALKDEDWAQDLGLQVHVEDLEEDSDAIVTSDEEDDEGDKRDNHDDMAGLATRTNLSAQDEPLDEFAQLDALLGNDTKQLAVDQAVADQRLATDAKQGKDTGGGFQEVPADTPVEQGDQGLDAVGLALATEMLVRKKRREIIEGAYNRWAHNDDPLPMWFADEEQGHREGIAPMTKEMAEEIKQRMREINARPLKKVMEAKARKKAKMNRQMGKLTKQAETIMDNEAMTEREKGKQIEQLYKQYYRNKNQHQRTTLVVAKKHNTGKRPHRPAGLKGRYQMVDTRMKSDLRGLKLSEKRKKKRARRKGK